MQQPGPRVRIGKMLPPQGDVRLFAGYPEDQQSDLLRAHLGDEKARRALQYMEDEGRTFTMTHADADGASYAVGVKRNAKSRSDNQPPKWLDNWRSNLLDAYFAAEIAAQKPLKLWIEAPEAGGDLNQMSGAIVDLLEINAFEDIEELIISIRASISDEVLEDFAKQLYEMISGSDITLVQVSPPSGQTGGTADEDVVALQSMLRADGHMTGAADGIVGSQTVEGVRNALAARDLEFEDPYKDFMTAFPNMPSRVAEAIADRFSQDADAKQATRKSADPIKSPQPDSPAEAPAAETAPYYPDDPARIDQLNRKSVAEALATIIDGVSTDEKRNKDDKSFVIHLHGPWGSGKTSILYFLEQLLGQKEHEPPPDADPHLGPEGGKWIVVHYNAWRMQDQGPPWWTLIEAVYKQALRSLKGNDRSFLKRRHILWRFQHDGLASVAQIALMAAAILVLAFGPTTGDFADLFKGAFGLAGSISAAFFLKGEGGLLNSKASQRYKELAEDPIGPLTKRFTELIKDTGRPVAIFIDDLDRCDAAYVVELLTQIQTLFRKANVLYVVAGDRNWICSSYEQTYEDFSDKIASPGHSLGHMFLEKIFQISVEVPEITDNQRRAFLNHLLRTKTDAEPDDLAAVASAAEEDLADVTTEAEVIAKNDAFTGSPAAKAVYAAAALKVLHRPKLAQERQKHILQNYADLLEPNPRAMKRLLNAYGFRRGYDIQAAERSDQDALIRWTILENRWPVMASYLGGKTVTDAERSGLIALKTDKDLLKVYDAIEWDKLPIVKGADARFDELDTAKGDG